MTTKTEKAEFKNRRQVARNRVDDLKKQIADAHGFIEVETAAKAALVSDEVTDMATLANAAAAHAAKIDMYSALIVQRANLLTGVEAELIDCGKERTERVRNDLFEADRDAMTAAHVALLKIMPTLAKVGCSGFQRDIAEVMLDFMRGIGLAADYVAAHQSASTALHTEAQAD